MVIARHGLSPNTGEYLELELCGFEHALDGDMRENELLTVKEVAAFLRVSRVTVWRWCQRGVIPASRLGRNWRIRRDDLLALLESPVCIASTNNSKQYDDSTQGNNNRDAQTITAVTPKYEKETQTSDEDPEETSEPYNEQD